MKRLIYILNTEKNMHTSKLRINITEILAIKIK